MASAIAWDGAKVTVTGSNKESALDGKTVIVEASLPAGAEAVVWTCNGGTVPVKYLPASCKAAAT